MNSKSASPLDKLKTSYRTSGALWTVSLALQNMGIPAFRFWPEKRFSPETVTRQTGAILESMGMPAEQIDTAVKHINYSDIHGIDSHGCGMLRHYYRQVKHESLNLNAKIEIVRQDETTALIDGDGGLGHIPADAAMKLAIEKCRNAGIGAVAVRNSGHFGAAGSYAAMASGHGLIGIAMTNIKVPAMVPTYGTSAELGTNPIAFSAPAGINKPFLLDMATSIVPVGKIVTAWRKGRFIPPGWAMNRRGRRLRAPGRAISERRLTPLGSTPEAGSYKGYGLAAMVEILTGILPEYGEDESGIGHFFLALDPVRFGDITSFRSGVDNMIDSLRNSPARDTRQPVQVAGDPEYKAASERLMKGIPLPRVVIEDIRAVCNETGAPFLLEHSTETES